MRLVISALTAGEKKLLREHKDYVKSFVSDITRQLVECDLISAEKREACLDEDQWSYFGVLPQSHRLAVMDFEIELETQGPDNVKKTRILKKNYRDASTAVLDIMRRKLDLKKQKLERYCYVLDDEDLQETKNEIEEIERSMELCQLFKIGSQILIVEVACMHFMGKIQADVDSVLEKGGDESIRLDSLMRALNKLIHRHSLLSETAQAYTVNDITTTRREFNTIFAQLKEFILKIKSEKLNHKTVQDDVLTLQKMFFIKNDINHLNPTKEDLTLPKNRNRWSDFKAG